MNMQVYHQIAEINTKVKTVRALLAQMETRQASLQRMLMQYQSRNGIVARQPRTSHIAPTWQGASGDEYIEALIGRGALAY
jgi:hypothetical protein